MIDSRACRELQIQGFPYSEGAMTSPLESHHGHCLLISSNVCYLQRLGTWPIEILVKDSWGEIKGSLHCQYMQTTKSHGIALNYILPIQAICNKLCTCISGIFMYNKIIFGNFPFKKYFCRFEQDFLAPQLCLSLLIQNTLLCKKVTQMWLSSSSKEIRSFILQASLSH